GEGGCADRRRSPRDGARRAGRRRRGMSHQNRGGHGRTALVSPQSDEEVTVRATRIAGWVATTAGALLVAFVVVISALRAQEAAVDPVAAGAAEEVPAPTVVTMDGAPAAVVPAPSDATVEEVRAVAEQSAENLKAVASGEVSLAAATRDPTSGAP